MDDRHRYRQPYDKTTPLAVLRLNGQNSGQRMHRLANGIHADSPPGNIGNGCGG